MSLLTICQGAADALSLPTPTAIVGDSSANSTLLLRLAKREGRELMRRHNWQSIQSGIGFTYAGTTRPLESDFDRFMPESVILYNSTKARPVYPFTTSASWNAVTDGTPTGWWLQNDLIYIAPGTDMIGDDFLYSYMSKNYCKSSGGTGQSDWLADSDIGRIPEHLMELGLTWRWLRAKGMDYAEEMATYEREVEKAAARDRPYYSGVKVVQPSIRDFGDWNGNWPAGTITVV